MNWSTSKASVGWLVFDLSSGKATAMGIALTVLGSFLMAVGNLLMKLGIHMAAKQQQQQSDFTSDFTTANHPYGQPMWWIGMGIYTLGAILHAMALAYSPASVLAPMNSFGLIANAIIATVAFGEPFEMTEAVGTVGTIIGVTFCAVSSFLPHDESKIVSGMDSWTDPLYLIFIASCAALAVAVLIVANSEEVKVADQKFDSKFIGHLEKGHIEMVSLSGQTEKSLLLSKEKGCSANTTGEMHWEPKYPSHLGMLYGFMAGLIGAQCVLELKVCVACVKAFLSGEDIWTSYKPYIASLLCLLTIILQMHFLNFGLGRGEATLVIPTYYVFWTIFGILGGFAKFHEFSGFSALQISIFCLGVALTLLCVLFMAIRDSQKFDHQIVAAVQVLTGEDLETEEARRRRLRNIQMSVPLALGYGILRAGKLLNRRLDASSANIPMRRTRSYQDLTGNYGHDMRSEFSQSSDYERVQGLVDWNPHWTVDGSLIGPYNDARRRSNDSLMQSDASSNQPNPNTFIHDKSPRHHSPPTLPSPTAELNTNKLQGSYFVRLPQPPTIHRGYDVPPGVSSQGFVIRGQDDVASRPILAKVCGAGRRHRALNDIVFEDETQNASDANHSVFSSVQQHQSAPLFSPLSSPTSINGTQTISKLSTSPFISLRRLLIQSPWKEPITPISQNMPLKSFLPRAETL